LSLRGPTSVPDLTAALLGIDSVLAVSPDDPEAQPLRPARQPTAPKTTAASLNRTKQVTGPVELVLADERPVWTVMNLRSDWGPAAKR
jgi:hypothetical protein